MNPVDYLDPSDSIPFCGGVAKESSTLTNITAFKYKKVFPEVKQGDVVILGVPESRNSSNLGSSKSPDLIRSYLYGLSNFPLKVKIVDAGNLKPTKTPSDSYSAIKDLVDFFLGKEATIILLGGTQEISLAVYQAICIHRKNIGVSFIDSRLDLRESDGGFCATNYVQNFLEEPIENLFNISLVGYQNYLVDPKQIDLLTKKNHEAFRLGFVRGNFREVEPIFRDSDFVSLDLGSIRHSDCAGNINPSPNGLYAEEVCQLTRFSGLSDRTCCFGIFELNSDVDPSHQSAHLSAQIIWHFIEAFSQRKGETPYNNIDFKKFIVKSNTPGIDMVFYKSMISDNWWMEIPTNNYELFPKGRVVIACSYNDYVLASKQELPERWIRVYNKVV